MTTYPLYSLSVIFALTIVLLCDFFILKTQLITKRRWWWFLLMVVALQTIVDNYLNGRWWLDSYIVGPYPREFYSGILIIETPLENYGFGIAMIWTNVMIFEFLYHTHKKGIATAP